MTAADIRLSRVEDRFGGKDRLDALIASGKPLTNRFDGRRGY